MPLFPGNMAEWGSGPLNWIKPHLEATSSPLNKLRAPVISLQALTKVHLVPSEDTYSLLDGSPFIHLFAEYLLSIHSLLGTILGARILV